MCYIEDAADQRNQKNTQNVISMLKSITIVSCFVIGIKRREQEWPELFDKSHQNYHSSRDCCYIS